MGYVTTNQLERARQIKALDYVLANEAALYKRVGNGYRMIEHPSFAVGEKGFYWHSQSGVIKGKTALDYLTDVRGYHLVDAVCMLLGERPQERSDKQNPLAPVKKIIPNAKPPPERIPFTPPLRNKDNRRVIAYLQSRGIERNLILNCIEQGSLYESYPYHNAVFTGKDENGKTRFAALRGTTSNFKRDADGSDKRYGFVISPDNPNSREVAVFEAPINCLSHQTLCEQGFMPPFDGWRLSLGGTSILAFEHFMKLHPEVTHCFVCTDNDEAGEKAAVKIAEMPGITTERLLLDKGTDWNDWLQGLQKAERTQNRANKHAHDERRR